MIPDTATESRSLPDIMPHAPEAVCLIGVDGRVRFATPMAARFYGHAPGALVGRLALRFIAPEARRAVVASWQALFDDPAQSSVSLTTTVLTAGGGRRQMRCTLWRVPQMNYVLLLHHLFDTIRDRLETLYSVLEAVSGTPDLHSLLDSVLEEVWRLVPSEGSTLLLLNARGELLMSRSYGRPIADFGPDVLDHLDEFPTLATILETCRPLLIANCDTDPRWTPLPGVAHIRSWLGVPLIVGGEVIGVLNLDSLQPDAFHPEDADLVYALGTQVAAAVWNARRYHEEQQRAARYQALSEVGQAISRLDLNGVLDVVHEKVAGMMDASVFFIGLYDPEAETVRLAGARERGQREPDIVISAQEGITGTVLRTSESIIVMDARTTPLPDETVIEGEVPLSLLMIPLVTPDETVGVLSVQSYQPHAYTDDDVMLLKTIAGTVASAIRNARLYDEAINRLDALEQLYEMGLQLSAVHDDPDLIAELTAVAVLKLFAPTRVQLLLWGGATGGELPLTWSGTNTIPYNAPRIQREFTTIITSIVDDVRHSRQPVILTAIHDQDEYQREFDLPWLVHAVAAYPIVHGSRQIGVVTLLYGEPHVFRRDMLRTLELLCLHAGTALANARQTIHLRRRLTEVTTLHELAHHVSRADVQDDMLQTVAETLREAYQCKSVSLNLLDDTGQEVITAAAAGLEPDHIDQGRFQVGEFVAGRVVETGRAIYVPDTYTSPGFRLVDPSVRSMMAVPLTVHGHTIGSLCIDAETAHAFNPEHERILTIAGGQIAAAIENIRLLNEARDRAEELAVANAGLRALDELRRELVDQVTHDLRNPLSVIYGYAGLLNSGEAGPLTDEQKDMLDHIINRARSIEQLTHDILSSNQINREALNLSPLDLNAFCEQAVQDARIAYRRRNPDGPLGFAADLAPGVFEVEADSYRLRRVLDNLLGNATKFSVRGGTITLRTIPQPATHEIWVSIQDEGIGIPAERQPYLFERFYQGDLAIRKQFGGLGLGLYIVKLIVEAHCGRVWVESEAGVGSTFTFALPLLEPGRKAGDGVV